MSVRPFVEDDIPQAADLYWKYLRNGTGPTPSTIPSTFQELFFNNPLVNGSSPSLVFEGKNGKVLGFLGVVPRKASIGGKTISMGFGGNLVVDPAARTSFAAARILAAYTAGQFDLCQSDSSNDMGRKLLERMGFRTIPALNVHWARPLRPAQYAAYYASRAAGSMSEVFSFAAKPFCSLADSLGEKFAAGPFRVARSPLRGAEMDLETHLRCLTESRNRYSLWAEYDADSLKWLLDFMARRPQRGTLRKIVVHDDAENIVGWYVYYAKPGAIGEVVQIGGELRRTKDLLDHLFSDAWEQGVIALHGVVDLRRVPDFSEKNCLFTCRGGWACSQSRKPEVLDALERGDAFLTRLDGEWCLDPGD